MSANDAPSRPSRIHLLRRNDVLAGILFIAFAVVGLWASRSYPIGTVMRMGTGYVPRLLCWVLLGLGVLIFLQGLRAGPSLERDRAIWRAMAFAPLSLFVFAMTISSLGVIVATVALVAVASLAGRESRPLEVAATALGLVALTLTIFVWGVGLPIPVWPER